MASKDPTVSELMEWEEELNKHQREILERERAVQLAEQHLADRPDVERTDYLFDKINRDNRKMFVEVPPVVQIVPPQTNHIEPATFIMATIAAVGAIATLVVTLIV